MSTETPETLTEALSEAAHDAWMDAKRSQGVTSRLSEWGEELMVPYAALSEQAKDLDRSTVSGVLAAIDRAGYVVAPTAHEAMVRAKVAEEILTGRGPDVWNMPDSMGWVDNRDRDHAAAIASGEHP